MLSWMFSLSFIGFIASKSPVEESVMFYERGISPSNMLLSFFVKHSSQSSCTSKMSFFGYFSKCFSPNNSLGLVLLSIFSLLHFSPNSPLEMLLSICSSQHFSPSDSWGSMGLSNCLSSWYSPRNSSSSSINKKDPFAPAKGIVSCNIPMELATNHYIKKYMQLVKIWNYYINMNIVMHQQNLQT